MAAKLTGVFEKSLQEKITGSKILVVGAGGIGCEILKNLVLSGFADIEIIDLDTIDVSNLNRQFLFHKEHVGKSKANVARDSALSFNPDVNIKAYHDSILTTDYGVSFFQRFNVVLNALDNRQARNHVNRMCLTADVPLIESGTAGYNGQVELIKKGMTQCYECTPKAAQKSYPGCTIRNTPSEPIHCIVWAKHLFNQLFGEYNADEDVSPDTADPETSGEAGADALNANATAEGNVERTSTRKWAQSTDYNPEKIFNKLFHDDIEYLLSMANLWKSRTPPIPIKYDDCADYAATVGTDGAGAVVVAPQSRDQKIWTLDECAQVLAESITAIKQEAAKLDESDHLVWDKDDRHAMDFVAACANIRSKVFGIAQKSRFEIKSMAGNIIPAIATTNAITAGIVVMHTFKVLQEQFEKCYTVYVRLVLNPRNQLFVPEKYLMKPNPSCMVCAPKPEIVLKIDCARVTVRALRDDILIKTLNMVTPDVIVDGKGTILISSDEDETECNNDKLLKDMGIVDGCILKVDDFFQNYELTVTIVHRPAERDDAALFEVIAADPKVLKPETVTSTEVENAKEDAAATAAAAPVAAAATAVAAAVDSGSGEGKTTTDVCVEDDSDDDVCIVDDSDAPNNSSAAASAAGTSSSSSAESISSPPSSSSSSSSSVPPKKRKTGEDDAPPLAKRSKPDDDSDDDLILIDDD